MRRFLTLIISSVLISLFVSPAANSATVVVVTEPTHRLSDGVFFDDQLSFELTPAGRLGRLVYLPNQGVRSWQIDPATISEIVAMSTGYGVIDGGVASGQIIAQQWLAQLIKMTRFEKVSYITYGNPSAYWVNEISKGQLNYINALSEIDLETALGKAVFGAAPISGVQQSLSKPAINLLKYAQRQINLLTTVVGQQELDLEQLRLIQLLNPNIDDKKLANLYQNAKAFLFSSVDEEFGIAPIEAMGHGLPVIAFKSGGLIETVKENSNGYLFNNLSEDSLIEKIKIFESLSKDKLLIMKKEARANSENFTEKIFETKIKNFIKQSCPNFQK